MSAHDRIRALTHAARRLADAGDALGSEARRLLPESTGLSPENVELGLSEILETEAADAELDAFVAAVEPAPRVHVQLAANVFTAPLRALCLGLAQSAEVYVRASRREPVFTRLLWQASPTFRRVEELRPEPGDHVWAYGSDATLGELERALRGGVVLHAHGSGFGLALVAGGSTQAARALVHDMLPFDQRGCLSPRAAVVVGTRAQARAFAQELSSELERASARIPLGRLDDAERAESVRLRETLAYAGEVLAAGPGWVALDETERRIVEAPVGRNMVIVRSDEELAWLADYAGSVVAVGLEGPAALAEATLRSLPEARHGRLGRMQRPPFDGPVDRRPCTRAHLV